MAFRALIYKPSVSIYLSHFFSSSRSFASKPLSITAVTRPSSVVHFGRRHLISLAKTGLFPAELSSCGFLRCFSTRPTTSSLNDPSPNWSNRPPKETILLDGCDFEHWLCVMEPPEGNPTRDEIIDSYIKTLAEVVGSEDEARMKIYSVSTRCYFAFGALVSEELSYKIKALPKVRWVLPDSYLDVKNKDYGGEPFIDGKAVPYDPKYHEEWIRNNARANERSRRNDRPRNFDRSRNFERRRENMQNRDFPNRDVPPMPNQQFQNRDGQNPMPPRDVPPPIPNPDGQSTMPPRDSPQPQYSNRDVGSIPNQDFQGRDGPSRDLGGMPTYQNQMPSSNIPNNTNQGGRGYQGGGGYQGSGNAYQGGGGYQGGGNAYQGGGGGYQGGGSGGGVQGGGNTYQGGSGTYQRSGNVPLGGGATYQGSGNVPQGGGATYQGSGYSSQEGGGAYQGSSYPTQGGGGAYQGDGGTYQGSGNTYQGRDVPPLPNRENQ